MSNPKFSVVTPQNASQMKIEEALKYCILDNPDSIPPLPQRLNVLKLLYKALGYELTPDAVIMLLSEVEKMLVNAIAGAGKTSTLNVKIYLYKFFEYLRTGTILNGKRVLYLVYNGHNVDPMIASHRQMLQKLQAGGLTSLNMDSEIMASTVHAFCRKWMSEYPSLTGFSEEGLLKEAGMKGVFEECLMLLGLEEDYPVNYPNLLSAYQFLIHSMLPFDSKEAALKAKECNLTPEQFDLMCRAYQQMKAIKGKFDFLDMIYKVIELVETYPDVKQRMQDNYDLIVYDEGQDFTRLMIKFIQTLSEGKPLMSAGDSDQTIYGFTGADPDTMINFPDYFEGGKIFTLNKNRRCSANIVEAASVIIKLIENRYDIEMIPARPGGLVEMIAYTSEESQARALVQKLKQFPVEDLDKIAIIYRNTAQATLISSELTKAQIAHNLKGDDILDHEIFKHLLGLLNCFMYPYVQENQLHLYKVLPKMTRDTLNDILGYDFRKKSFTKPSQAFYDIDFGSFETNRKFQEARQLIRRMSEVIDEKPLKTYFPYLFDLFKDNYWMSRAHLGKIENNEYLMEEARSYFMSDKTFPEFFKDHTEFRELIAKNKDLKVGPYVGTFHSVKGKEYDRVFLTYMDDAIMPARSPEELAPVDIEKALNGEISENGIVPDSETRLLYVALTRARYENYIFYKADNPSYYVKVLMDYYRQKEELEVAATMEITEDIIIPETFKEPAVENSNAFSMGTPKGDTLKRLFGGL